MRLLFAVHQISQVLVAVVVGATANQHVCGKPGVSEKAQVYLENVILNASSFPNMSIIHYECPISTLLIGYQYRTCLNGVWTNFVPKCASRVGKRVMESILTTIHGRTLDIAFRRTRVAAIIVYLESILKLELKVQKVLNIDKAYCHTVQLSRQSSRVLKIDCKSMKVTHGDMIHFIRLEFDRELQKDALTADPFIVLYAIDDKCNEPDVPLNAFHIHKDVSGSKADEAIIEYSCKTGQISSSVVNICPFGDNWQLKRLPHCVEVDKNISNFTFVDNENEITNPILNFVTKIRFASIAVIIAAIIITILFLFIVCVRRKRVTNKSDVKYRKNESKEEKSLVETSESNRSPKTAQVLHRNRKENVDTKPHRGVTKESPKKRVAPAPPAAQGYKVEPTAPEELAPAEVFASPPPYNPGYEPKVPNNARVTTVVIVKDEHGSTITVK